MRALLIASLLTLPLAAPAAAGSAPNSTVLIKGKMNVAGARCRGAMLIPRTAESEREIVAMFGTTEPSTRAVTTEPGEQPKVNRAPGLGREAPCSGWTQGFSFRDVAPGDYFVTALASGYTGYRYGSSLNGFNEAFGGRAPQQRNIYLMRPVSVSATVRTVQITLTQD